LIKIFQNYPNYTNYFNLNFFSYKQFKSEFKFFSLFLYTVFFIKIKNVINLTNFILKHKIVWKKAANNLNLFDKLMQNNEQMKLFQNNIFFIFNIINFSYIFYSAINIHYLNYNYLIKHINNNNNIFKKKLIIYFNLYKNYHYCCYFINYYFLRNKYFFFFFNKYLNYRHLFKYLEKIKFQTLFNNKNFTTIDPFNLLIHNLRLI
jgi:hypothetical protein